ncbi:MAG: FG-GAP-like repeat-containing protein, partial [Acidimicrobiales bacterium]
GQDWFSDAAGPITELPVGGLVTGVIPVDLGDGPAVLTLGYRDGEPAPDLIIDMVDRVVSSVAALPGSDRLSTVAAIADFDDDELVDIWVGRDIGWQSGGDSIYSRTEPRGDWVDVAVGLGAALEVDSAGLVVADLNGDNRLDAYVSDLGDNELLLGSRSGFAPVLDVGVARIRSADAADNEISRSWGSGAVDWNLDGLLDIVVVNGGFSDISVPNKVVNTFILESDPPSILLATGAGSFVDAWPIVGPEWSGRSRGLTLGDVDGDGDVDMIVVDHEGALHAIRNDGSVVGQVWSASTGCLSTGSEARVETAADSWTVLTHQLSFLGGHAPQVISPPGSTTAASCKD